MREKRNTSIMINREDIEYKLKWIQELLRMFVQFMNIEEEGFTLSVPGLINIVMDVDEEIGKIKQFHNLSHVSIVREVSLYCYYILKRRPIIVIDEAYTSQMNEKFCAFILLSSTESKEVWDKDYLQFLVSMFYRGELTKDAIYLLAMTMHQVDKLGGKKDGD